MFNLNFIFAILETLNVLFSPKWGTWLWFMNIYCYNCFYYCELLENSMVYFYFRILEVKLKLVCVVFMRYAYAVFLYWNVSKRRINLKRNTSSFFNEEVSYIWTRWANNYKNMCIMNHERGVFNIVLIYNMILKDFSVNYQCKFSQFMSKKQDRVKGRLMSTMSSIMILPITLSGYR